MKIKNIKNCKPLLVVIGLILLGESIFTGLIPHSRGYLFGLLQSQTGPIYLALGVYLTNYLCLDFFCAVKGYAIIKTSLLFRTARTEETIKKVKGEVENTPQRIQEDIKLSYESRFIVWSEYIISGIIVIQLIIINLSQPILIFAALTYAGISVIIALRFNPKLTRAEKEVQRTEATYRHSLIDSLSLTCLPLANKANLMAAKIRTHYLLFTRLQLGVMSVLPYVVLIPSLLSGDIDLGTLVKHQATFALIVVNASILIQLYPKLVKGRASEERVREVEND